jgi:hypothetical protein
MHPRRRCHEDDDDIWLQLRDPEYARSIDSTTMTLMLLSSTSSRSSSSGRSASLLDGARRWSGNVLMTPLVALYRWTAAAVTASKHPASPRRRASGQRPVAGSDRVSTIVLLFSARTS